MGVDRTDYIVYGWKLPYEVKNNEGEIDFWDDKFLPYIEGHKGEIFSIIKDGMCGEYTVFGVRLARSKDDGGGWGFMYLEPPDFDPEKVKVKYLEVLGIEPTEEPRMFIFSHFN